MSDMNTNSTDKIINHAYWPTTTDGAINWPRDMIDNPNDIDFNDSSTYPSQSQIYKQQSNFNYAQTYTTVTVPVDPDAPENPKLEHGDAALVLYPHADTWNGSGLIYPHFFSPIGADCDRRTVIVAEYGTRFKAGQSFVYLGIADSCTYIHDDKMIDAMQLPMVQFLVVGKLQYMYLHDFDSLRFMKI